MLYSIDFQHFMTHAIDYFTVDEILGFNYMIISAKVKNGNRLKTVVKPSSIYPTPDMVTAYADYKDPEILNKMYEEYFTPGPNDNNWQDNVIYCHFIQPLLSKQSILMISDQIEYDYLKSISWYLKNKFLIETIDLNELFSKGKIGPISIDMKEIYNKAVDVRRTAERIMQKEKSSTSDGRAFLLSKMTKKEKIKKLKSLGISVNDENNEELTTLLVDAWVNDNDEQ